MENFVLDCVGVNRHVGLNDKNLLARESSLVHFVLNRQAGRMAININLNFPNFNLSSDLFKGNDPWTGVHQKVIHRWSRLQNNRRNPQKLFRKMGKDCRCGRHEGSKDQAFKRLRFHLILEIKHGWWCTTGSSSRHRWQVSKAHWTSSYSSSSESKLSW